MIDKDKTKRWKEIAKLADFKVKIEKTRESITNNILEQSHEARNKIKERLNHTAVSSQVGKVLGKSEIDAIRAYGQSLTKALHLDKDRHEQKERQKQLQTEKRQTYENRACGIERRLNQIISEETAKISKKDDQIMNDSYTGYNSK